MGRLQKANFDRLGRTAGEIGGTIGAKARDVGGTVGTKAKQLQVGAAPTARKVSKQVGEQTRKTRRKVGFWIAGEEPPKRRPALAALAVGAGAAAAFFLDPANGKRRRDVAKGWTIAGVRLLGSKGAIVGRGIGVRASGLKERVTHQGNGQVSTDDSLEQKVQRELVQEIDVPSGQISIVVTGGIVSLRGVVQRSDQIQEIERRVRGISGVRDVENVLHLEGTPAPTSV